MSIRYANPEYVEIQRRLVFALNEWKNSGGSTTDVVDVIDEMAEWIAHEHATQGKGADHGA